MKMETERERDSNYGSIFSRFDTMHEHDRQTNTAWRHGRAYAQHRVAETGLQVEMGIKPNRTRTHVEKTYIELEPNRTHQWDEPESNPNHQLARNCFFFLKYNMKWLSENDVAYRLWMEAVNIWILMSGCMDYGL